MEIPDCYDPVVQAERLAGDDSHCPVCGCCGHRVRGGEKIWTLFVGKNPIIVCEDCKSEMEDNVAVVEEVAWEL